MKASLVNRNVVIAGHRTSIRLEGEFWEVLDQICRNERLALNQLCTWVDRGRGGETRTSALRSFIIAYLRADASGVFVAVNEPAFVQAP